jgi:hypothetical protein
MDEFKGIYLGIKEFKVRKPQPEEQKQSIRMIITMSS